MYDISFVVTDDEIYYSVTELKKRLNELKIDLKEYMGNRIFKSIRSDKNIYINGYDFMNLLNLIQKLGKNSKFCNLLANKEI